MPNIYSLTKEYNDLFNMLIDSVNEETGEVDEEINKALEIKKDEVQAKSVSIACVIRKIDSTTAEIEQEIERLNIIKERCKKAKERLKNSLSTSLQDLGIEEVKDIHANISFRKSKQTIIDDENLIPEEYKKAVIKFTISKTDIKNAIENGIEVAGAHIEEVENLQIR